MSSWADSGSGRVSAIVLSFVVVQGVVLIKTLGLTIRAAGTFQLAVMMAAAKVARAIAVQYAAAAAVLLIHLRGEQLIERARCPTPAGDDFLIVGQVVLLPHGRNLQLGPHHLQNQAQGNRQDLRCGRRLLG